MKSLFKYFAVCIIIFLALFSCTAFADELTHNNATIFAESIDFVLKSGDSVLNVKNSVYIGFSVGDKRTIVVNDSEYNVKTGGEVDLKAPTKLHYNFVGWFKDEALTQPITKLTLSWQSTFLVPFSSIKYKK